MVCVHNSRLEDPHTGQVQVSKAEDGSDVFVVDAEGNWISWTEVSRIGDDEMPDLMQDIVNRLYTYDLCADDPALQAEFARWISSTSNWDDPEIIPGMIRPYVPVD